jgi:hypothetical protein
LWLCIAIVLLLSPNVIVAQDHAAKIQEVLALAKQNYKKSFELNPKNTNAIEVLKLLDKLPVVIDAKVFDTYVGEYEVGPGFVMRVFREGDKFMTQATGQAPFEIFPESETTFYPRVFAAKLTFVKDADGKVNSIRIEQGGRVTLGKRIK